MDDPAEHQNLKRNNNNKKNNLSADDIHKKYAEERAKRLRSDGNAQFIPLQASSSAARQLYRRFASDPWAAELNEAQAAGRVRSRLASGSHTRVLIVGAGYGGLYFAVKLLQQQQQQQQGQGQGQGQGGLLSIDDLLMVDTAGGFGGTWYWNRYPGLMCDVESYIYMPLLEEMGYMPRHKYAGGNELRNHANAIAERWDLHRAAMFKTRVTGMTWDEDEKRWTVDLEQETREKREEKEEEEEEDLKESLKVHADFVILATGLLNIPKMPGIPGIVDRFRGHSFHTSRWDYAYTGGSPEDPRLTNLRDKKVGVVGTGATAIQAVPSLARWAKELYIFQRTPSSVDVRDNRETDADWWARSVVARGKGWQRERMENYNSFITNANPAPETDMVADSWTRIPTYCALVGGPDNMDPDFVERAYAVDLPRQERLRSRVEQVVSDDATAQSLKAWYASWCKRPCFHDEYLQAFNEPNVHLVDTDGRGISHLTERGVVVASRSNNSNSSNNNNDTEKPEYELDLIIFSTGFAASAGLSPGSRAGFRVTGRDGMDMDDTWTTHGIGTLHGIASRGFPNLFFPGPYQGAASPNQTYLLDILSTHIAYIIGTASDMQQQQQSSGGGGGGESGRQRKFAVEPTVEAQTAWGDEIAARASSMAAMLSCTPSYLTAEGARFKRGASAEEKWKKARMGALGSGVNDFVRIIEEWRARGDMEGLEVRC